jgi:hypothetical protein
MPLIRFWETMLVVSGPSILRERGAEHTGGSERNGFLDPLLVSCYRPSMAANEPLRIGIVGAGRTRNGLGPFLARAFEKAGARIVAVAGRDLARAEATAAELAAGLGHPVAAASDVGALTGHELDAMVIAAPVAAHLPALRAALAADVPVFCEKPLVGPEEGDAVAPLVDAFCARGLVLMENCQWPMVLPAWETLFPDRDRSRVQAVAMGLAPATGGPAMLEDSLSHLLSVVQAVAPVGPDTVWAGLTFTPAGGAGDALVVEGRLVPGAAAPPPMPTSPTSVTSAASAASAASAPPATAAMPAGAGAGAGHGGPGVHVRLELAVCTSQPRPAWLALDGARMDRVIDMPGYRISFVAGEKKVTSGDPLQALVYRFAADIREDQHDRNGMEARRVRDRARLYHAALDARP